MSNIRTLVVDDDALARKRIRHLLKQDPDIEIIGESSDGEEAATAILKDKPDLVYLDVQMPKIGGFEVLELIRGRRLPKIVFVTAFDQFALKAFEFNAVDYLLKPFTDERFRASLNHIKAGAEERDSQQINQKMNSLLDHLKQKSEYLQRILVKTGDRIFVISLDDVVWFEASAYYIKIHLEKETHLFRETMKILESRLDPGRFIRIHRSYIVNLKFIQEIQAWFKGDYMVILKNGHRLTISGSYRKKVFETLEK